MPQSELLKQVIKTLEEAGIDYMITGSVVSSLQGEPRSTHDIDLVVAIEKSIADKLVDFFPPPNFYLDRDCIIEAIDQQNMFNLIDTIEGDKVDFWILTGEAFDQSRFSRKCTIEFMGITITVSSPEDTILAKLRWAKLAGGSEKQFIDALRVFELQYKKLNLSYLENWVRELQLETWWIRLKNEAEVLQD